MVVWQFWLVATFVGEGGTDCVSVDGGGEDVSVGECNAGSVGECKDGGCDLNLCEGEDGSEGCCDGEGDGGVNGCCGVLERWNDWF